MIEQLGPAPIAAKQSPRNSLASTRLMASAFLSRDECQALESAALAPRSLRAGIDLSREGEGSDQLCFVTEGWVCRYKTTRGGSRQIVGFAVPGDVANLDCVMFKRSDRSVRTLTAATVVAIPRDRLLALEAEHVGIAQSMAWLAMVENAILGQWALCLGRQSAHQRLAHLLCELNVRLGGNDQHSGTLELPLTQEQIADALGLTTVHVNRTMQHLRNAGLLVTGNRTVTLLDVRRLQSEAEFDPAYLHIDGDQLASGRPAPAD